MKKGFIYTIAAIIVGSVLGALAANRRKKEEKTNADLQKEMQKTAEDMVGKGKFEYNIETTSWKWKEE